MAADITADYRSRADAEDAQHRLLQLRGVRVTFESGPQIQHIVDETWRLTVTVASRAFFRPASGLSTATLEGTNPVATAGAYEDDAMSMVIRQLGNAIEVDVDGGPVPHDGPLAHEGAAAAVLDMSEEDGAESPERSGESEGRTESSELRELCDSDEYRN